MTTFSTAVNGINIAVNQDLTGYAFYQKQSSHIAFYGVNADTKQLVVQYTNGKCIVFNEVPPAVLAESTITPSIGKFLHSKIYGKFNDEALEDNSITVAPVTEEVDDDLLFFDEQL